MRILVAEDDAPLAEVLHQRLLQEQFAVQMVSTGVEAQRMASDQSYDLVVLDLNSHGSVGLDVLRGIRKTKPDFADHPRPRPARAHDLPPRWR